MKSLDGFAVDGAGSGKLVFYFGLIGSIGI